MEKGLRYKSPQKYVEELRETGGQYFFDVGDDFLFDTNWLRMVAEIVRSSKLEFKIAAFGRIGNIDDEVVSLLRQIGVYQLIVGFESGDCEVLQRCKPGADPVEDLKKAELCLQSGVGICGSYVVGLPRETDESLERTVEHALRFWDLVEQNSMCSRSQVVANMIEVHPGSILFSLLKRVLPRKYECADELDIEGMQQDYYQEMFGLTKKQAKQFRKDLLTKLNRINLLSKGNPMGVKRKDLLE